MLQAQMTFPLNELGVIKKFNGIYVKQTRHYTLLNCEKYIKKVIDHHGWTKEHFANKPTPMNCYDQYITEIQAVKGPEDKKEKKALEKKN